MAVVRGSRQDTERNCPSLRHRRVLLLPGHWSVPGSEEMSTTFTVFFSGQFWVGLLEIVEGGNVRAARHVFGAEPSGAEILAFTSRGYDALLDQAHASPPAPLTSRAALEQPRTSPKRRARISAKERAARVVGTAAQAAIKAALAAEAVRHEAAQRAEAERHEEQRRAVKRTKAKARHRGRS